MYPSGVKYNLRAVKRFPIYKQNKCHAPNFDVKQFHMGIVHIQYQHWTGDFPIYMVFFLIFVLSLLSILLLHRFSLLPVIVLDLFIITTINVIATFYLCYICFILSIHTIT